MPRASGSSRRRKNKASVTESDETGVPSLVFSEVIVMPAGEQEDEKTNIRPASCIVEPRYTEPFRIAIPPLIRPSDSSTIVEPLDTKIEEALVGHTESEVRAILNRMLAEARGDMSSVDRLIVLSYLARRLDELDGLRLWFRQQQLYYGAMRPPPLDQAPPPCPFETAQEGRRAYHQGLLRFGLLHLRGGGTINKKLRKARTLPQSLDSPEEGLCD